MSIFRALLGRHRILRAAACACSFLVVAALLGISACAPGSAPFCGSEAPSGHDVVVLFRGLAFAREDDGVSEGFDLDGRVSNRLDGESCRQPDFTAPDGTEGIDNQIARLLPLVEAQTGGLRLDDVLQTAIDNGQLLIALEIEGVNNPRDDACVTARLRPVVGTPLIGTDGRVLPGQTFDVAPEGEVSTVRGAWLAGGALELGPAPIALPVQVLDARFTLHVEGARLRLERRDDGTYRGVLGGGISVDEMIEIARGLNIPPDLMGAVSIVLRSHADLARDETGQCRGISATLIVDGVPAFLYED